jgi:hypothetical protein
MSELLAIIISIGLVALACAAYYFFTDFIECLMIISFFSLIALALVYVSVVVPAYTIKKVSDTIMKKGSND